jgi:hypothetical protein
MEKIWNQVHNFTLHGGGAFCGRVVVVVLSVA